MTSVTLRCTVGDVFDGTVARVEPFRAFVEIVDGGYGFLHASEWKEQPQPGTPLRVKVLDLDVDNGCMSVGLV